MHIVRDDAEARIQHPQESADTRSAIAWLCAGFLVTLCFGLFDPLGVVHADDLTHFLFAKWAWRWPSYLLNEWGRPGFTVLYFPPAYFGWTACRVLSVVLTAVTAWLTFLIARGMGLRAAWAVVPFCYLQPLVFKLAQTTLTETPLMFYLTLALFLAQRGRWTISAAIISLGFVTRHEAVIFLPLWIIFARRERVPLLRLGPIIWAPLVVNALAPMLGVGSILTRMIDPSSTGQYGRGGWLTFFARSMEAFGPALSVLAMIGLREMSRSSMGLFAAACAISYFVMQTAIRALGLYDAGGYARFLVPISPIVAIAGLHGWHELFQQDVGRRRRAALFAVAAMALLWIAMERQLILHAQQMDEIAELPEIHYAKIAVRIATVFVALAGVVAYTNNRRPVSRMLVPAVLVVLIVLTTFKLCRPVVRPPAVPMIEDSLSWLRDHGYSDRQILSANVWIDHLTHRELPPNRPTVHDQISDAPVGTIFIWEKQFAGSADHKLPLDLFANNNAFRLIHQSTSLPYQTEPYLRLFEKIGPWDGQSRR